VGGVGGGSLNRAVDSRPRRRLQNARHVALTSTHESHCVKWGSKYENIKLECRALVGAQSINPLLPSKFDSAIFLFITQVPSAVKDGPRLPSAYQENGCIVLIKCIRGVEQPTSPYKPLGYIPLYPNVSKPGINAGTDAPSTHFKDP
jgi:hypothetical protein